MRIISLGHRREKVIGNILVLHLLDRLKQSIKFELNGLLRGGLLPKWIRLSRFNGPGLEALATHHFGKQEILQIITPKLLEFQTIGRPGSLTAVLNDTPLFLEGKLLGQEKILHVSHAGGDAPPVDIVDTFRHRHDGLGADPIM